MPSKSDIRENRTEFLLNNMVDKDVQSMLLPLNLMQNIMFCPKYRIKNNFIGPISLIHNFVSLIGTGIFIYTFFHRLYLLFFHLAKEDFIFVKHVISLFDSCYYSLGLAMNFISGVCETKRYISFVLVFQKIHRFLNDAERSKRFTFWNWFCVVTAGSFFAIILVSCSLKLDLPYFYILSCYSLVSFDFNYVYAIRLLKLLEDKVLIWSIRALNPQGIEDVGETKRLFEAYVNILECYEIYKMCFQKIIFCYTVEVFIHSLVYFQVVLEIIKLGVKRNDLGIALITSFTVYLWSMKNLMLQATICQQCEKFYIAVEKVQDSCAIILHSYGTDEERKPFRNIQRLHRASFRRIHACGLFYVDAVFLLTLMGLLTNYIVVLLANAFL